MYESSTSDSRNVCIGLTSLFFRLSKLNTLSPNVDMVKYLCLACGSPKSLASNNAKLLLYPKRASSFRYKLWLWTMYFERMFFTFSHITTLGFHCPIFSMIFIVSHIREEGVPLPLSAPSCLPEMLNDWQGEPWTSISGHKFQHLTSCGLYSRSFLNMALYDRTAFSSIST